MFIEVSVNLKKLSKYFPENLYVVGGYVRNKLLKINDSDVDLASCVDIEEVARRLQNSGYSVKIKNLKLGTILISKDSENYEYTAFRKEKYDDNGRHCPSFVERTDKVEEDAVRRDFSINSIYYNINKDEIVDFYQGIIDLKQRIIRCNINPDKILSNDGERILRMVRIAGELNFDIDKNTLKAAQKYVKNIGDIKGSRRLLEIEKILGCEERYNVKKGSIKRALRLLNILGVWQYFGLKQKKLKYNMVFKCDDKFTGLLIDIIDTQKPKSKQEFLETFLKEQFGLNQTLSKKYIIFLSGYYDALNGKTNKGYFLKYFEYWPYIYPLLWEKSKRVQGKYNFFYQYIIEHNLAIKVSDLQIDANDIKNNFKDIDKRDYDRILDNLLSKVFDGQIKNEKTVLLAEIKKNIRKD